MDPLNDDAKNAIQQQPKKVKKPKKQGALQNVEPEPDSRSQPTPIAVKKKKKRAPPSPLRKLDKKTRQRNLSARIKLDYPSIPDVPEFLSKGAAAILIQQWIDPSIKPDQEDKWVPRGKKQKKKKVRKNTGEVAWK